MIAKIDIQTVNKTINKKLEDALVLLGAAGVSWVTQKIRFNKSIVTGNLINSITYSTKSVSNPVSNTTGSKLEKPTELSVKIGTNVVYAARVEFGFIGQDSLGRTYNQLPKSYLRAGIAEHKKDVEKILARGFK